MRRPNRVYMGDTTIADLRIVAPDVVYVYGRKIGSTNLIAISAAEMRANVAFRVVADAGSANSAIRDLQPTTHTKLRLFGNRVAATGRTRLRRGSGRRAEHCGHFLSAGPAADQQHAQLAARNRSISGYALPRCRAMTSSAWASGRQAAVALRLAAAAARWMPS